jgi:hypothetical protein
VAERGLVADSVATFNRAAYVEGIQVTIDVMLSGLADGAFPLVLLSGAKLRLGAAQRRHRP